jgi:hypothetical protein
MVYDAAEQEWSESVADGFFYWIGIDEMVAGKWEFVVS